ncbi:MAG: hypothetical protein AAGF11_03715 [Myxococcota bacterium]
MSPNPSPDLTGTQDQQPRLELFRNTRGMTWRQKLPLLPIRVLGGRYPGPQLVLIRSAALLGKRFVQALQVAMRESDYWSKEELELFAAFTANQLQCAY